MTESSRYPVPAERVRTEEVIKRSRFITSLGPAASVDEARAFIGDIRSEYSDATHNCWAYLIGAPGSTARVGMSDDGEPHGTAGRPMLTVLQHCDAGDVVSVVTRFYGGTKLGKGGLVKAYTGGVQLALEKVELRERVSWKQLRVAFEYSALEIVRRFCPDFEAEIEAEDFSERVLLSLRLPEEQVEGFTAMIMDRLAGRVEIS